MKLPKILIIIALVVCIFGIPKDGNAVSLQGCISTGIIEANTHSHVSVLPSRIYAVLVTPTSANGYVQIFDTKSVVNDTLGDGRVGNEYVSTNKCLADLQGAVANQSLLFTFPLGVNAERLFVDTNEAVCEIYYKE